MKGNTIGRPMEILLVEDSLTFAQIAFGALKKSEVQHRLTWIANGEEALEFLKHEGKFARAPRPDLILLDLGLPQKDGREVLAEIRADEELQAIPVVVMTASTDEEDRLQSERLQVEAFLTKPLELAGFLELLKKLRNHWRDKLILPTL